MSKYPKIEHVPYVPHYRQMKITPTPQSGAGFISSSAIVEEDTDNPRIRKPSIATSKHVPYAEAGEMFSQIEAVPNVGNNIEHTWVGVDGDIVDDLGINEESSTNLESDYNTVNDDEVEIIDDTMPVPNIGEYVIVFNGQIVSTGNASSVQEDVRSLVFGEHELCKTNNINVDDLIVLKRIPIKVGVFIE